MTRRAGGNAVVALLEEGEMAAPGERARRSRVALAAGDGQVRAMDRTARVAAGSHVPVCVQRHERGRVAAVATLAANVVFRVRRLSPLAEPHRGRHVEKIDVVTLCAPVRLHGGGRAWQREAQRDQQGRIAHRVTTCRVGSTS